MCIIIAKPSGIDLPLEETYDNCFNINKDGIGISYNMPGETVHITKGFQNVKKLMTVLNRSNITKEHNLVIHFRYATHGKKDAGNCHPFPLTNKFEEMRWLNLTCQTSIAHNGVFSGVPQSQDYSDTMKFIGGVLAQPEIIDNLNTKGVKELIKGYCGYSSKLAFLRPTGLSLIGDFELDGGVYYSNRQYKKYSYTPVRTNWDRDTNGNDYCYKHQKHDRCSWCNTHREMDECNSNTAQAWKDRFKDKCECEPDLSTKCVLCTSLDQVKWNNDEQDFLCLSCSTVMKREIEYN